MGKKKKKARRYRSLQVVTLCISTAMVLVLLGMVVFSVLTARNLSAYVKENLTVTLMLADELTNSEAEQYCQSLGKKQYISNITFISKEQALKELTEKIGTDPSEFAGFNPAQNSVEVQLRSDYANSDSIKWIAQELKKDAKVQELTYPKDMIDSVNRMLTKINLVLLVLAVLLSIVSFSLINSSIKLGVYARRFSIHTMKLVGASWGFIRRPFIREGISIGIVSALIAIAVLAACVYALYHYDRNVLTVITWEDMCITAGAMLVFGVIITLICTWLSVNRFLRRKAGELYKI